MKTVKNYLKTIPLAFVLLTACSKDESPVTKEPSIYIAGNTYYSNTDDFVATLWKDGNSSFLTDKTTYSEANDLFVTNTDVYVGGYISGSNENSIATIWKNGNPTYLADETISSYVNAIHVAGSDVYAVGNEWNSETETGGSQLWKNGEKTAIGNNIRAKDIFVHKSDIYVVGNNGGTAVLWKNGTITELSDETSPARALAVYANDTDVYVIGQQGRKAAIWKNGILTYLTDDSFSVASARAIYVDGSDVYVVGYIRHGTSNYTATLWKNGVITSLTDGTQDAYASDIAVMNDKTYIVGYTYENDNPIAKFWEDGNEISFGEENTNAEIYKIYIK